MSPDSSPLERLATTIVSTDRVEDLLPELAQQFAEAVGADLAVVRLREGERLRTRTALGFHGSAEVDFEHPVELLARRAGDAGPILLDPGRDEALIGPAIAADQIFTLHGFPLRDRERVDGLVLLGWRTLVDLDAEQRAVLAALAAQVAPALSRLRAIAERDAAIADAQRALELRDKILGVVAHDLRNPLNVITTAVELLEARISDVAQRRHLERITRSVQRAERLVRDLLEVNAIEGSGLTIDKHRVEVVEVVLAALESQQTLAANASVVIATDLSPNLPAIHADELRLQEVLENLVSNAIKFNQSGSAIVMGAAPDGDMVRFWVRDNGIGIPPEHLPHVFERFWQGVKRDRRGAGLGLSICRAIVDAHGGRIWAESDLGGGTTMLFTIPAAAALDGAAPPATTPCNILLVDDRRENLIALSSILEHADYKLITANSGEEALRTALREEIMLALIDVAMPGMSGLDVASHLKKLSRYRDLPILFITAFGDDPEQVHRAYAAGGADYIVKPLDAEVVRRKVAVFVELARRARASRIVV